MKLRLPFEGPEFYFNKVRCQTIGLAMHPPETARIAQADRKVWGDMVGRLNKGAKGMRMADEPAIQKAGTSAVA